jgi:hypothetical protein
MSDEELNRQAQKERKENSLNLASSLAPPARAGVALFAVRFALDLDQMLDFEKTIS